MKYSIMINQAGIVKAGLHKKTDIIDWLIIDYLKDWFFISEKKTHYDSTSKKLYVWVNYQHLMDSMPMLGINDKNALTRRFKKLKQLGLIDTIKKEDNTLFFILTELCISICFHQEKEEPIKKPNSGGAIIPPYDSLSYDDTIGYHTTIRQGIIPPYDRVSSDGMTAQVESSILESPILESSIKNNNIGDSKKIESPQTLEDFIAQLKENPAYKGIDIEREINKMKAWLSINKGRRLTKRFIINWLNRIDYIPEEKTKEKPVKDYYYSKCSAGVRAYLEKIRQEEGKSS